MVKNETELSTEQKILLAARTIFIKKGMAGARMQDIANEAGINKALLHYYFRSKEQLFEVVFWEAANQLFLNMNGVFESELPLFEKIELFVSEYLSMVISAPFIPQFLFTEINRNPEEFFKKFEKLTHKPNPLRFISQLRQAMEEGLIHKTQPFQLMMNLISMIVFPFIGKPMFQKMFGVTDADFFSMMEARKKYITGFVINAIKINKA